MRLLGLTLAAAMVLACAGESNAQLMIGNPYSGRGVFIGPGGVSVNNGFGYNNYGVGGYGAYGAPMTGYYSSGYVAPGFAAPYAFGGYPAYSTTSYIYPSYGYRTYSYGAPLYYRRGLFGRRWFR